MEQEKLVITKNKFLVKTWIPIVFALATFILCAAVGLFALQSPLLSYSVDKGKNVSIVTEDCVLSDFEGDSVALSDVDFPKTNCAFGEIEIKSADIKCPLFFGNSDEVFEKGAGQYIGSSIPGYNKTSIISAHNNTFFKGLETVTANDEIVIRTTYGVYRYKVVSCGIFMENDDNAYKQTDSENLILYTCHRKFGTIGKVNERFFVYATLLSGPAITK